MKKINIILALSLVGVLLCGCGSDAPMGELAGEWYTLIPGGEDGLDIHAEIFNLFEEERAFVDVDSLQYVRSLRIDEDGSYCFYIGVEENKAAIRSFYEGVMAALYDNRAELTGLYGEAVLNMTREEFYQSYAAFYGMDSYDEMIKDRLDYGFGDVSEPEILDEGTFAVRGDRLVRTGEGESGSMGFELNGDTLTLEQEGSKVVYTRAK